MSRCSPQLKVSLSPPAFSREDRIARHSTWHPNRHTIAGNDGSNRAVGNEVDPILIDSDEEAGSDNIVVKEEHSQAEVDSELATIGSSQYSDVRWANACEFFGVPLDTVGILLEGTLQEISGYQMLAVWWLLSNTDRGTNGGILADEMGLGKTRTTLAMLQVRKLLLHNRAAVLREWEAGPLPHQRRHNLQVLADGDPSRSCPASQVEPEDGVCHLPCYCLGKRATRNVVRLLDSGYALITTEASIAGHWQSQADGYIDSKAKDALYFAFGTNSTEVARATHACIAEVVDAEWNVHQSKLIYRYSLQVPENTDHYVFVVGNTALRHLSEKFQAKVSKKYKKQVIMCSQRRFAPTVFVMDEVHRYKGGEKHMTIPFRELQHARAKSNTRPILVTLTGTPVTNTLLDVYRTVEHMSAMTPATYRQQHADYPVTADKLKYLHAQFSQAQNPSRAITAEERAKMKVDIKLFFDKIMMKRRIRDGFRDTPLAKLPERCSFEIDCAPSQDARDAVKQLKASIQSFCIREFQQAIKEWRSNPRKGPKPTASSYCERAVNRDEAMGSVYSALLHSSVFPGVAILYQKRRMPDGSPMEHSKLLELFGAEEAGKAAKEVTTEVMKGTERGQVVELIRKSPYWKLAECLLLDAPKIRELLSIVDKMSSTKEGHPLDGSPARHMTIFAMRPAVALLIFMILYMRRSQVDVRLFHKGLSTTAPATVPQGRRAFVSWFQERCSPQSRPKIMVATYQLGGNGLDLSRGNYCVLVGRDFVTANETQAQSRTYRMGQQLECYTYTLEDNTHPVDQAIKRKMDSLYSLLEEEAEES